MAKAPVGKLIVPRYGERRVPQASMPDVKAWAVDAKAEDVPVRLRMKPEFHEELSAVYPELPEADDLIRGGGFLHGRPMKDTGIEIETCGGSKRPATLYRVIHAGQPYGGIKARGYGIVQIKPFYFQILVQKHLNWGCRNPSPFISVTDNLEKVKIVAAVYEARGFSAIQILEFNTIGPEWNNEEHRLWNVRDLVDKFDTAVLKRRKYLEQEFLVENSIPPESIIRRSPWELMRNTLDPDGFSRKRMKSIIRNSNANRQKRAHEAKEAEATGMNDEDNTTGSIRDEVENDVVVKKRQGARRVTDFKLRV
ncbi:hypothetical protein F4821DRAFT_272400 [Hypoxylon rubiginosum]|uniref:Uncharacterized protein n=1 Tax=Hypoxylon rubiginosum TaxID=110542 RepID=A0ACC0CQ83_9PEZI|nr:hypothetical protein F4821DRAFT_272400 [Hypoxylon rubiginosum]